MAILLVALAFIMLPVWAIVVSYRRRVEPRRLIRGWALFSLAWGIALPFLVMAGVLVGGATPNGPLPMVALVAAILIVIFNVALVVWAKRAPAGVT